MWFTAETSGVLEMQNFTSPYMNGRTYVRTDGRTIASQPKFLGCTEKQIFLPMVLCCARFARKRAPLLKYRQVRSDKPLSGAGSTSCRPGSVQYWRVENHKTANWSLRQGDEEVNKRTKQKIYIFWICSIFWLENQPSSEAEERSLAPEEGLFWANLLKIYICLPFYDSLSWHRFVEVVMEQCTGLFLLCFKKGRTAPCLSPWGYWGCETPRGNEAPTHGSCAFEV